MRGLVSAAAEVSLVRPNLLLHLAAQVLARVNLTRYNLRATDALLDTSSNVLAILGTSAITNTAGSS